MNYQQKLENIWLDISKNKLFKIKNFLKDLYLTQKYDLRMINPDNLKLRFNPQLLPDCANCQQNCCQGAENTVSLRLIDIARLLDAGLGEAIDLDNQSFRQDEYFKKDREALKKIDNDNWNYFPVLKRINNICPYRDKNNKCTIYQFRPVTCRRFPYILASTKKDIVFSLKCHKTKQKNDPEKQQELFKAAIDSYNEKVKDLILIYYAKNELFACGFGRYLILK